MFGAFCDILECEAAFLSLVLPFEIPLRLPDPLAWYMFTASGDAHFFSIYLRREDGLEDCVCPEFCFKIGFLASSRFLGPLLPLGWASVVTVAYFLTSLLPIF